MPQTVFPVSRRRSPPTPFPLSKSERERQAITADAAPPINGHSRPALAALAKRVAASWPRKLGRVVARRVGRVSAPKCGRGGPVGSVEAEVLAVGRVVGKRNAGSCHPVRVASCRRRFVPCHAMPHYPRESWKRSYSSRPGNSHPKRMRAVRPRAVWLTCGSLKSSGSKGPGGRGRGLVVVRTPVDVLNNAGRLTGQGGSGGNLGACVGRGAGGRGRGIGAEGCFGRAPSSSAGGRGRGARGVKARGASASARGGCCGALGALGALGASEGRGRGRSWILYKLTTFLQDKVTLSS